jgi:putative transposase
MRRSVFRKYGNRQRNRIGWILNNVSASVVGQAKERGLAIVMEDIKGIRKLYRRGNGQGKNFRASLNSWSYHELQREIEYKARWEGIPVTYVAAWGTKAKCSMCGSKTFPNEDRTLYCPKCKTTVDRDVNAALNILEKGALRFGADGFAGEAVKGNETKTQSSESMRVS